MPLPFISASQCGGGQGTSGPCPDDTCATAPDLGRVAPRGRSSGTPRPEAPSCRPRPTSRAHHRQQKTNGDHRAPTRACHNARMYGSRGLPKGHIRRGSHEGRRLRQHPHHNRADRLLDFCSTCFRIHTRIQQTCRVRHFVLSNVPAVDADGSSFAPTVPERLGGTGRTSACLCQSTIGGATSSLRPSPRNAYLERN